MKRLLPFLLFCLFPAAAQAQDMNGMAGMDMSKSNDTGMAMHGVFGAFRELTIPLSLHRQMVPHW